LFVTKMHVCAPAAGENPENDAARIEQLLRLGAHAIAGGGDEEQAEDKGMAAEGIDQVRAAPAAVESQRRTSTASF
jgi:hypothetical protein